MVEHGLMVDTAQRTLKTSIPCVGIGLHSGQRVAALIRPAEPSTGIRFVRKDVPAARAVIPALWHQIGGGTLCTTLRNARGTELSTVEHLLAALRGCGIDNALVEVDGPEVPILDGSAEPFVTMIERAGVVAQRAPRWAIVVREPVEARDQDRLVRIEPWPFTRITAAIDFPRTAIGAQRYAVDVAEPLFKREIAGARTFGLAADLERLHAERLALGGSCQNAVIVDDGGVVNEDGLRFAEEFARHKILDIIGDLALAGVPIIGHVRAHKPGHTLNHVLLRNLFTHETAWSYVALDELDQGLYPRRISEALAATANRVVRMVTAARRLTKEAS